MKGLDTYRPTDYEIHERIEAWRRAKADRDRKATQDAWLGLALVAVVGMAIIALFWLG